MTRLLNWLLLGYLALFPFGQLARLPITFFDSPEVSIYLTDLVVVLISVIYLIGIWQGKFKWPPLAGNILGFLLAALLSLSAASFWLGWRELFVSFLYLIRLASYILLYGTVYNLARNKPTRKTLLNSLILLGVVLAVFGWLQYIFLSDIRPLTIFGWDEHYKRIVGTFLDPNFTAIILVLALILTPGVKTRDILIWLFLFVTLLFTYSRSGYGAILIGMSVVSWMTRKPVFLATSLLLILSGILFLPRPAGEGVRLSRTTSIELRLQNWQEALTIFKSSPLLGVGFDTLRYVRQDSLSHAAAGVDNSILFILVTTGVIGLVIFLSLIVRIWIIFGRKREIMVLASLSAVIFHSMFTNSLFYPWVLGWMAILFCARIPRSSAAGMNARKNLSRFLRDTPLLAVGRDSLGSKVKS
ncbi:O-antigen ligase family protein [Candidatus Microgenomates bacterium]|nr:O-antigen ligase family protein [Candidatus Microgenomates bacterium]